MKTSALQANPIFFSVRKAYNYQSNTGFHFLQKLKQFGLRQFGKIILRKSHYIVPNGSRFLIEAIKSKHWSLRYWRVVILSRVFFFYTFKFLFYAINYALFASQVICKSCLRH